MISEDLQAPIFLLGSAAMVLAALLIINYMVSNAEKQSKQIRSALPDTL